MLRSGAISFRSQATRPRLHSSPGRSNASSADQPNTVWQGLSISPRTCPSRGAQLCSYLRWFARPSLLPPTFSALRLPIGVRRLRIFLRFRRGCHGLPVDVDRRTGLPRTQRVCLWCPLQDPPEVWDERHLIFLCPALEHIRLRCRHLLTSRTDTMVQFL